MPPSLPTGTVSQTSAGTRTFPPEPDSDTERERVSAASTPYRRPPRTRQPLVPDQPQGPPTPVVPRREHDVALAREHDRVAELARENEALREYIREQATDRQAVIERYEHLLSQRDTHSHDHGHGTAQPTSAPTPSPPDTPSTGGPLDTIRRGLSALRSRVARLFGRD